MSLPSKFTSAILTTVIGIGSLSTTGCFWGVTTLGPNLLPFSIPVPVTPYLQKKKEDEFWQHERYDRAPILGPLTSGADIVALDPPSDDEVMRALEKAQPVQGGFPFLHEHNRNDVRIVKEKIADYIDPPRVYPLIGPAQQHHAHYKCTVYYEDVRRIGWPFPHTLKDEDAREVIYVDHNHLHMVGNVEGAIESEL
ncbi:hypothetical protein [Bythopirellula polymerisocia]|uniref:Uncharacterized protein n=1 Tax=Bythopirellula polymerisocia TaxID=2528003 RepID=A0A5C6CSN9_9BACT|nr:hypothetical protein [Bythopirellula polymerisocia]TWU27532.1 hypothetical protein Pla144_23080 [Bythopirellula polymerisocia]